MTSISETRPELEVFSEIGVIEHHVRLGISRHLPEGVSYAQFEVLMHLVRDGDGQTPGDLARDMLIGPSAMAALLRRMEAQGQVSVMGDIADPRQRRVRLTRKGREAHAGVLQSMAWKTDTLREGFTEAEFRAALPFLRALRTFLSDVSSEMSEPEAASLR